MTWAGLPKVFKNILYKGINSTVCPRSSNPIFVAIYYIKWITTSWTYSSMVVVKSSKFICIMSRLPVMSQKLKICNCLKILNLEIHVIWIKSKYYLLPCSGQRVCYPWCAAGPSRRPNILISDIEFSNVCHMNNIKIPTPPTGQRVCYSWFRKNAGKGWGLLLENK